MGGTGVNVGVAVAEGRADAMLGGAEVAQAESKTSKRIQTLNRYIRTFLKRRLLSHAKVSSESFNGQQQPSQGFKLLVYYRLNGYKVTQLEFDAAGSDAYSEGHARAAHSPLG